MSTQSLILDRLRPAKWWPTYWHLTTGSYNSPSPGFFATTDLQNVNGDVTVHHLSGNLSGTGKFIFGVTNNSIEHALYPLRFEWHDENGKQLGSWNAINNAHLEEWHVDISESYIAKISNFHSTLFPGSNFKVNIIDETKKHYLVQL
jgi:hypothetical protein